MRVVILGATGQTGQEAVAQALEKGHSVTAVVRNPDKVKIQNDNLKVVTGDVLSEASLSAVFPEHDAVMSCLGFSRNPQPVTGYSESMKAITAAMRTNNIKQLVTMTSWYTDIKSSAKGGFIVNWLLVPFIKPVLMNMFQMEQHLQDTCQDLDYTVVRPPGLSTGPVTGKTMTVAEDYLVDTGASVSRMSRADVAAFMVSLLGTKDYAKKCIAITPDSKK